MLRDLSMTSAERAGFGVVFVEANVAGTVAGWAKGYAFATGARRVRLVQQFVVFFGG